MEVTVKKAIAIVVGLSFGSVFGVSTQAKAAPQSTKIWAAASVQRVVSDKIMAVKADGQFHGDQPVTRFELAVTLDRFIHYIENGRKPLHAMSAPAVIPKAAKGETRSAYAFLTSQGFLPAASPLITQQGDKPVTAQELADAMGEVTIRISDRGLAPQSN